MTRTAYLHIGTPKAGSTTIQGFLGVYRDALLERGLEVPDFGRGEIVTGALQLTGALSTERRPDRPETPAWIWLAQRLTETSDDICVSREGFSGHLAEPDELAFTQAFFESRGTSLKLIAYIRDNVSYLNAAYTQQAKKLRVSEDFYVWSARMVASGRYSFWRRFRAIVEAGVPFSLRPLHEVADGKLVEDFCAEIDRPGMDVSGFDATPFRNATPGPKAIAASILVGRELKARGMNPDDKQVLQKRFTELLAARGWDERPFFGPDAALIERFEDQFAKGNRKLARKVWGCEWDERMPTTRRPQNILNLTRASDAERAGVEDLAAEFTAGLDTDTKPKPFWARLTARRA